MPFPIMVMLAFVSVVFLTCIVFDDFCTKWSKAIMSAISAGLISWCFVSAIQPMEIVDTEILQVDTHRSEDGSEYQTITRDDGVVINTNRKLGKHLPPHAHVRHYRYAHWYVGILWTDIHDRYEAVLDYKQEPERMSKE